MENFLESKAVENKKNNSAYRSWEGGTGDEGISALNRKMELTHSKVHSPSGFPPLPTSVTQRGSGEMTYEERTLSMCGQLLLLPSEGTKPQGFLLGWRRQREGILMFPWQVPSEVQDRKWCSEERGFSKGVQWPEAQIVIRLLRVTKGRDSQALLISRILYKEWREMRKTRIQPNRIFSGETRNILGNRDSYSFTQDWDRNSRCYTDHETWLRNLKSFLDLLTEIIRSSSPQPSFHW